MQIFIKGNKLKYDKKEVVLPKYVKISDEMNELQAKRRILTRKYFDYYNSLLNSEQVDQIKFDELVMEIHDLEDAIENLTDNTKRRGEEQDMIANIRDELYQLQQSDKDVLQKSKFDINQGKVIAKNFKKKVNLYNQLSNIHTNDIVKYIKYVKSTKKPSEPTPVVLQPKPKVLTNKEVTDIKKNITELLKRIYMFKDKQECISKQRSKPFFTSKEEILKEIEKNDELKKLMPSNYKTFTKEKLCDFFFDG